MQKYTLFSNLIRFCFYGIVVGISALVVFFGGIFVSIAYAQNNSGGIFGDILSKILASNNWQQPGDYSIKNAKQLNGIDAKEFQVIKNKTQQCPANQCVIGFNDNGIICK